jgi:DNA polymerase-3 subunit beta
MKVHITDGAMLRTYAASLAKVAQRRGTMSVLSCVELKAEDGKLRMRATSLDSDMVHSMAVDVDKPGRVLVDARAFADALGSGSSVVEILGEKKGALHLRRGKASVRILVHSDDMPREPGDADAKWTMTTKVADLRYALGVAAFSSTDATRANMCGVNVERNADEAIFAATDGHTICCRTLATTSEGRSTATLPPQFAREVDSLLRSSACGDDDDVELEFSERHVIVAVASRRDTWGESSLACRLVDAAFPDYRKVAPAAAQCKFTVDGDSLHAAIADVSKLCSDDMTPIRISAKDGELALRAIDPDRGEIELTVPVTGLEEFDDIAINARLLSRCVSSVREDTDRVSFHMTDKLSPVLLTPPETTAKQAIADSAVVVVMPMRF